MSIKRKKMISAICWPLGYHLETHRLQKDAILQCSSAQFSTIWVFGIGHQMMHLASFHHSTKHSSGKLENHQLSSLPGRSPRLPWRILVVTMSRNVPTCLGCRVDFICCIVIGIAPQQSGQMAGFRWCVLNIIHVCPACIYANVDYGDDVVVVIYWWLVVYIIDGGCERIFWLSSSERYWMDLNGLFPNTSTTSLSWLPMPGQLRCPQEAAVWHLVNFFEHHLMGNRSKFNWENWFWLRKMGNFNGKIDFPSFHGKFCWIFHGFSPEPQPPDTAVVFRYWDSMQISFLGLQHHCKARRVIWSHMESLSLPQHLRSLVTLVLRLAIS